MAQPPAGPVYLDHAAATPLRPEVAEAMARVQADAFGNPSSPHAAGRRARAVLEDARERIVAAAGGRTQGTARERLVFTSGATEANRLAVLGVATATGRHGILWLSAREHGSLVAAAATLSAAGWTTGRVPLGTDGGVAGGWQPTGSPAVVATTLVCGQTGVREPPAKLRSWGELPGTFVHVDATQAAAHEGPSLADVGAATLACAPHKFGGPRGIGGLLVRPGVPLVSATSGPQEGGLRGGTEPAVLAVGFAVALELAAAEAAAESRRLRSLRDRLEAELVAAAHKRGVRAEVVAGGAPRGPHIATIVFAGIDRQSFVMAADLAGVCCATGTACASGSSDPAPALVAMGLPADSVQAAVRFSLGRTTTVHDVDLAVERIAGVLDARCHHRP